MNPEVKTLWLEAPRSGKYRHGKFRLRYTHSDGNDCYCGLGVLCDLHAQHVNKTWLKFSSSYKTEPIDEIYQYGRWISIPEDSVLEWAGLVNGKRELPCATDENGDKLSLSSLNDTADDYLSLINAIEKYL